MGDQPPASPVPAGALSPDRQWYWDGLRWSSTLSTDGQWRWNGKTWEPVAPAGWPQWARPYASPAARATFVLVVFTALLAIYGISTIGDLLAISLGTSNPGLVDLVQGLSGLLVLVGYAVAVVAFCIWIHRVYRNLPALGGTAMRFSPGWAVGWWFVPIMNIWRPYQVVREVWAKSGPSGTASTLVNWWWALWLIGNYLGNFAITSSQSQQAAFRAGLDAVSNIIDAGAAVLAILIVRRITAWQVAKAT